MNQNNDPEQSSDQNILGKYAQDLASFPEELQKLVEDEIKDGNSIQSIDNGFPAAPCGASVKLARQVKAERRMSTSGVNFYARNNDQYSGEFTTSQRHFFVLEPPMPPEPAPDMDAIREEIASRQRAADAERFGTEVQQPADSATDSGVVNQFRKSMVIDYERWREGIGYAIRLLQTATVQERTEIERLLLGKLVDDWRDVEALAALNTPKATEKLRETLNQGSHSVVMAILQHAPHLVSDEAKTRHLVDALQSADFYDGLTYALHEVEQYHPPEIIDALLNCLLNRESGVLAHFAGMLLYLYDKADVPFDWDRRPFYLRFNTPDRQERETAFRELCELIDIDAAKYLDAQE